MRNGLIPTAVGILFIALIIFAVIQQRTNLELIPRLGELESDKLPIEISVDCQAGETITDALKSASGSQAPLSITIHGVCQEHVSLNRSNVTIKGNNISDGIQEVRGKLKVRDGKKGEIFLNREAYPLWVGGGAKNVFLENLTITGGSMGFLRRWR